MITVPALEERNVYSGLSLVENVESLSLASTRKCEQVRVNENDVPESCRCFFLEFYSFHFFGHKFYTFSQTKHDHSLN